MTAAALRSPYPGCPVSEVRVCGQTCWEPLGRGHGGAPVRGRGGQNTSPLAAPPPEGEHSCALPAWGTAPRFRSEGGDPGDTLASTQSTTPLPLPWPACIPHPGRLVPPPGWR